VTNVKSAAIFNTVRSSNMQMQQLRVLVFQRFGHTVKKCVCKKRKVCYKATNKSQNTKLQTK